MIVVVISFITMMKTTMMAMTAMVMVRIHLVVLLSGTHLLVLSRIARVVVGIVVDHNRARWTHLTTFGNEPPCCCLNLCLLSRCRILGCTFPGVLHRRIRASKIRCRVNRNSACKGFGRSPYKGTARTQRPADGSDVCATSLWLSCESRMNRYLLP